MPQPTRRPVLQWISARHLQHFISQAERAGADVDALLEDAGLVRARLADPDYQVPLTAVELMLSSVARDHVQPLIGLRLAREVQPAIFGPLGYIAQACASLSDVLEVMTRYSGMLSNIGRTSVLRRPEGVEVRWECLAGGRIFRRQAAEYVLGSLVVLARLLLPGRNDVPVAVNFAHSRPDSPRHAREYVAFFQCPVYFDRPLNSVMIPAAAVQAKLRHGDAFVKDLMERHAASLLRHRTDAASLSNEVRHLVAAMILDGVPTKDAIAAQLGMSGRSLHRRLQETGTSYRALLDDVRLEIARERLAAGNPAGEISDNLGFSNRQAFLRWFKQSTGKTPSEYRDDIQQQGGSK